MAKSLKTRGIVELRTLRSRVRRQHNLGRISRTDMEYLANRLDEMEARIVSMRETNEDGEEEG